jgi:hypothetical protein
MVQQNLPEGVPSLENLKSQRLPEEDSEEGVLAQFTNIAPYRDLGQMRPGIARESIAKSLIFTESSESVTPIAMGVCHFSAPGKRSA